MATRSVVVGDVTLAVHERGPDHADAPIVVLVHGYPDEHSVWDGVAARLATRCRVIAYDVRGAGASTAPAEVEAYRLDTLVRDLEAVIQATAGDRQVHLVGHDWGAIQAWEAVGEPGLASRIASYTAISGPCLDHVRAWLRTSRDDPRVFLRQALKSWYIGLFQLPGVPEQLWRTLGPRGWPWLMARVEDVRYEGGLPPTLIDDAIQGLALYRANMSRGAARRRTPRTVNVPVQLVVPEHDPFVSRAMFDGIEQWVPELTRTDVIGGHWIVRREPELVAQIVSAHLDRVGA